MDCRDRIVVDPADGPLRVFALLRDARPVLLNLGEPGGFDITPWADRVQLIDAAYDGTWELPAIGAVPAPTAVLIRPDGYVAWVGDLTQRGLSDALTAWFGPRTAATGVERDACVMVESSPSASGRRSGLLRRPGTSRLSCWPRKRNVDEISEAWPSPSLELFLRSDA
jgi:hypothetical protein